MSYLQLTDVVVEFREIEDQEADVTYVNICHGLCVFYTYVTHINTYHYLHRLGCPSGLIVEKGFVLQTVSIIEWVFYCREGLYGRCDIEQCLAASSENYDDGLSRGSLGECQYNTAYPT